MASFDYVTDGLTVDVTSTSSDPDGSIATSEWDFGDGATASGETAQHTYTTQGEKTITLTVTDNDGDFVEASTSVSIDLPNVLPTADFTATPTFLNVQFNVARSDSDGTIATYDWDFGDDEVGTGPNPVHEVRRGGRYAVTLTVTDNEGGRDSDLQVGECRGPEPAADRCVHIHQNGLTADFTSRLG